ncbi:DUF1868 domain-containing protein [Asticcacaulis sp. 201]|uniref:DUF1868 domain-containing protein n=1 Tax=Asticcacaulis sp. 201 TaxID=3028787 RepID=UPI0029163E55|nr:DUF1868 domain-containing protein [Asticcacaulis sp. 201]MDV6330061.1 DUF1868 domain-containing protein [Asticcacaulis sp. 201]
MRDDLTLSNRRGFLGLMAGAGAILGTGLASSMAYAQAGTDVGRKFFADGRVRPFAGNTIVCHLPQQGEPSKPFHALLDIYRNAPTYPFSSKLAWLPPSSYHMTVFGGANDQGRGRAGQWPDDIKPDTPMDDCNRILGDRLRRFKLDTVLPIRMRFDLDEPPADANALKLMLLPKDAAENARLRDLRNRLADCLKIHSPTHDAYGFHISLGYWLAGLTPQEQEALATSQRLWRHASAAAAPVIALGAPEFCLFKDMFAFERQFYLT